ncbi:MAG: ADP-ribosylglycohydrolase family protein [Thermoguttaceae bacterium]
MHNKTSQPIVALICLTAACLSIALPGRPTARADEYRRLSVEEYRNKMKAGWVGQMAGVGWGGPTEFRFKGEIIPAENMPAWKPEMINQFNQDDIYVEMTFLRTLEQYGLDVSIRQAGIDFATSGYRLWHANAAGRDNLRGGIAPPDSGHPQFNGHADDIDYQIEADYAGLIAPGLPGVVIELGEKFGRLMNYGDGLYGGQFVGGMYAEAFFESDVVKIIEAGLKCIPAESHYAETIRDMLRWYEENPDDWQKTWQLVETKYHENADYAHQLCSGPGGKGDFSIDAKLNGAYIVMGLLYGKGDLDQTILISTRCGQDSDCNPANSGGVLFTTVGFSDLPERFTSAIDPGGKFSHTPYTFPKLIEVSEKLVRQAVVRAGGRIEKDDDGEEVFVIPVVEPKPSKLENVWEPGPIAESRFTEEEVARINAVRADAIKARADADRAGRMAPAAVFKAFEEFAPGWSMRDCGREMEPGLLARFGGKQDVFETHPLNRDTGCVLSKKVEIPAGKKTVLRLLVGHHPTGDWTLIVRADGKQLLSKPIGADTAENGWAEVTVDLTESAGKSVDLELVNQPSDWRWEAAYWARIAVE